MELQSISDPGITQLLSVFAAGFLTSLTPCVYPLIPITIATFGGTSDVSRIRAFFLSCTYVLGIAFTYTALGIICAQTGTIFGSFLGDPIAIAALGIFMFLFCLVSLDIVQLPMLFRLQTRAGQVGGVGYKGAALMGAASGIVAAPCVGPVLASVLVIAASSQNTLWAGLLLFTYSLGIGVLFIALGTFSGLLSRLPRSGEWLNFVKFSISVGLLVIALFFAQGFLPPSLFPVPEAFLTPAIVIFAIFSLGAGLQSYRHNQKVLRLVSCIIAAMVAYEVFIPAPLKQVPQYHQQAVELTWLTRSDAAFAKGRSEGKLVMIDLFADWCVACKELDEITFAEPTVVEQLKKIVVARVDYNDADDIISEYGIVGLPSVLFIKPDGSEIKEQRVIGFETPEEFLPKLKAMIKEHG